ncbi:MAG: GntR family transcriptional regulator [Micromonosporaceae bacterium]
MTLPTAPPAGTPLQAPPERSPQQPAGQPVRRLAEGRSARPPQRLPRRLSLASQTVEALRELVLTGELPPGSRVNEVAVAEQLGISRGPLREAIRHLASEGLLILSPNRGATVPAADPADVRAMFELRTALECAAARLAASRRDERDVARLRSVCAESRATAEDGGSFPYRLDIAFHTALLDTARSPRIAGQVHQVQQQVILLRSQLADDPTHTRASLDDHDAVTEAIAAGDQDTADMAMRHHLDRVRDQMLAALSQ